MMDGSNEQPTPTIEHHMQMRDTAAKLISSLCDHQLGTQESFAEKLADWKRRALSAEEALESILNELGQANQSTSERASEAISNSPSA